MNLILFRRISDMLADAPYARKVSNNLINPQKKRLKMRRRKGRNKKRGRKLQNGLLYVLISFYFLTYSAFESECQF